MSCIHLQFRQKRLTSRFHYYLLLGSKSGQDLGHYRIIFINSCQVFTTFTFSLKWLMLFFLFKIKHSYLLHLLAPLCSFQSIVVIVIFNHFQIR